MDSRLQAASFVAQQLRPQVELIGGRLLHLRTGGGQHEIDFVVETGDGLYAFEATSSPGLHPADADQLRCFGEKMGDRLLAGYLVHTGARYLPDR